MVPKPKEIPWINCYLKSQLYLKFLEIEKIKRGNLIEFRWIVITLETKYGKWCNTIKKWSTEHRALRRKVYSKTKSHIASVKPLPTVIKGLPLKYKTNGYMKMINQFNSMDYFFWVLSSDEIDKQNSNWLIHQHPRNVVLYTA